MCRTKLQHFQQKIDHYLYDFDVENLLEMTKNLLAMKKILKYFCVHKNEEHLFIKRHGKANDYYSEYIKDSQKSVRKIQISQNENEQSLEQAFTAETQMTNIRDNILNLFSNQKNSNLHWKSQDFCFY